MFLVEAIRNDCVHACTVDDISHVLQNVPSADLEYLPLFILRQPKRKEEILNPVWGRYIYYATIAKHEGSAICLDTLLHDLGHHVDRMRNETAFETKTSKDKEVFAHRYADKLREILEQKGVLPFERIFDTESLESDKLRVEDFGFTETNNRMVIEK